MVYTTIGQPRTRIEGQEKVTGALPYTADVALPGTLWGRALRSPLPHARILRIDTSRAQQMPGVHAALTGAVVQGIGYGLTEELAVDEGKVATVNLGDYKIPNVKDIPELKTVVLESDSGPGPYNARGIGENPIGPPAPAIANAMADAVGVRIRDLPITAEKVYRALRDSYPLC